MNKDDIIRMAREAGLFVPQAGIPENGALTRFAALVAAAELRRLHEAHDWQYEMAGERLRRIEKLEAQRDALLEALKGMLHRDERNTCRHEETHRGGAIWEICDSCGAMWADDEGGKPEWEDPKEWTQARAAITAAEGEKP